MKISTKTYYGMRALAHLAKENTPCSAREVAQKEDLPLEYLEKIFQSLKRSGMVRSRRGAGGGYMLAYPAQDITLHDILAELEGPFFTLPCFSEGGCAQADSCHTKGVWETLNKTLDEKLESITLKDIIQ